MKSVRSIVAAAIVTASFAGSAFAREAVFTAQIEAPVAERTRVIALNTVWNCEGNLCQARPDHAVTVRACRHLAHETGARVLAYGAPGNELSAEELARCNREGGATQQARN
jgi:thiazole synthase ThiGH ThiG subunit